MEFFEITCIIKDENGIISHCGVKGYGIQDIAIIGKLIREVTCCFFIYNREKKKNVYARTTPNGATYLTTNPHGSDINGMNILPEFKRPFIRQLIESVH
ncbi:MAG TPA: hypothetical protein VJU13_09785 [Candidatus Nitrosocosmicus sp.]|nr:hypothetical protein [Candidatus Nitrosocosmicus sp.]